MSKYIKSILNLTKDPQFSEIITGYFYDSQNLLVTGHSNGEIILWDNIDADEIQLTKFLQLKGYITSISSLDSDNLIVSSFVGELIIINIKTENYDFLHGASYNKQDRIWRISPVDSEHFITSGTYGKYYFWFKNEGKWDKSDVYPYRDVPFGTTKIEDRLIVSGDYKGRILVWKILSNSLELKSEFFVGYNIKQIVWNDAYKSLIVLGRNGKISYFEFLEDKEIFELIKEFDILLGIGEDIRISQDFRQFIACSSYQILVYNLETNEIKTLEIDNSLNIFPHGEGVFVLKKDGLIFVEISNLIKTLEKTEISYIKVSLIGETGVGKSTLCNLLSEYNLSKIYSTVGKKTWEWNLSDNKKVFLQDLGGQDTALATSLHYILDSDLILTLFKQTHESTLDKAKELTYLINKDIPNVSKILIQTFIDQPNNDVEFINFEQLIKEVGLNLHLSYSKEQSSTLLKLREDLLEFFKNLKFRTVIQSNTRIDLMKMIASFKRENTFPTIKFSALKSLLKENSITAAHLKYLLLSLNDEGIIDYFPEISDIIILNDPVYENLKMRIPRWVKSKRGRYKLNDLISELSENDDNKVIYIKTIDQIYIKNHYSIELGDYRIFPSNLYLQNQSIAFNPDMYIRNLSQKLIIDGSEFDYYEFLDYLKEMKLLCEDISQNSGFFFFPGKNVYFYYLIKHRTKLETKESHIEFNIYYGKKDTKILRKFITNLNDALHHLYGDKIVKDFFFFEKKSKLDEISHLAKTVEDRTIITKSEEFILDLCDEDKTIFTQTDYIPNVMISYAHDSEIHKNWVKKFCTKLMEEGGINVILDQWDLNFGNLLSKFMEKLNYVDKIIVICSPLYKQKADQSIEGGVGYEKRLLSDILLQAKYEKIIPLTTFNLEESKPIFLSDIYFAVIEEDRENEMTKEIIRNIYGKSRVEKPKIGSKPAYI